MNSPYSELKILIVDDSQSMVMLIEQLLCNCNVEKISSVGSIKKAREILSSGAQFDGIILDLILEDGCGLELAKEFNNIPVVFCSTTQDDHNSNLMYHLGRKINKPVTLASIYRCVDYFFTLRGKK